jgi:hypothetical protein
VCVYVCVCVCVCVRACVRGKERIESKSATGAARRSFIDPAYLFTLWSVMSVPRPVMPALKPVLI